MLNSILIGKLIYSVLFNNEKIQGLCKGKIYPLVANSDTTYPYIVYRKTDISSSTLSKDCLQEDNVTFSVVVVDTNYHTGC